MRDGSTLLLAMNAYWAEELRIDWLDLGCRSVGREWITDRQNAQDRWDSY